METVRSILKEFEASPGAGPETAERLLPLVYGELRHLAEGYLRRERRDHTLQPTALVHEAFCRLAGPEEIAFESRAHFLGVAARAMRQVLVDHARRKDARKRGGDWGRVTLDAVDGAAASEVELIDLDEAMTKLADKEARLARVVELRFFGGLTIRETALVLGVAPSTVDDDWALARAWLARELSIPGDDA